MANSGDFYLATNPSGYLTADEYRTLSGTDLTPIDTAQDIALTGSSVFKSADVGTIEI